MSRTYRLCVFGREVFSWEVDGALELVITGEPADEDAEDSEESAQGGVSGGPSHNFERDTNPVSPDDRYAPWDDRFGFQP